MNVKGECGNCPAHMIPEDDGNSCKYPDCESNYYANEEGVCTKCDAYLTVLEDKTQCVEPTCRDRERISEIGECVECEPYTIPPEDKKGLCYSQVCGRQERLPLVIDRAGQCVPYDYTGHEELKSEHERLGL